jgi:hypothetical protein
MGVLKRERKRERERWFYVESSTILSEQDSIPHLFLNLPIVEDPLVERDSEGQTSEISTLVPLVGDVTPLLILAPDDRVPEHVDPVQFLPRLSVGWE